MTLQEQLVTEHRTWLKEFDARHLKKWDDDFSIALESALCEAAVRDVMHGNGYGVAPWADLVGKVGKGSVKRPDFRCSKGNDVFYVEVANISIETATKHTGLPHPEQHLRAINFSMLTKAVFEKARNKTVQCDQDLPTLLAVGTFHTAASYLSMDKSCANALLTGEPMITWNVDPTSGESVGPTWHSTNLKNASFVIAREFSVLGSDSDTSTEYSMVNVRRSISGILLCGFGLLPPPIFGVLHPEADRPFKPELLPQIPFGRLRIDHAEGRLMTEWCNEKQATHDM